MSSKTMTDNSTTTTNQDQSKVYQDLIGFLQSPSSRQDLKLEATKAVLQVVSDRDQVLSLVDHGVLLPLLRIVSDSSHVECCENALKALLYLCSNVEAISNTVVDQLLEHKAVPRLVELVMSNPPTNAIVNMALGVLANLSRTERGTIDLVGKTLPDEAMVVEKTNTSEVDDDDDRLPTIRPTMELLLDRFLNRELIHTASSPDYYSTSKEEDWDMMSHDPYQHFAAILINITQVEAGRKFVLRIPRSSANNKDAPAHPSVLQRLLPQLTQLNSNSNPIRRRGISGMVRNCCLETDSAWWMLHMAKILTPILYPLAGPEELDLDEKQGMDPDLWLQGPDKVREIDTTTRLHLVESLLLLCASGRSNRDAIRLARTYVILKYADMVEESEMVSERIDECVQYLRRDEAGTSEGSSDLLVEQETMTRTKLLALPSSTTRIGSTDDADYDNVD